MSNLKLQPDHCDVLAEVFNMGMGKSLNAISQLSGKQHEILFDPPTVSLQNFSEFKDQVLDHESTSAVFQSYRGDLEGHALMVYPSVSGQELAKVLIGSDLPGDQIEQLESDALIEIGNIFISSAISALGDFVGSELKTGLPSLVLKKHVETEFQAFEQQVIHLESHFRIDHLEIQGTVIFLLQAKSIKKLLDVINEFAALMEDI